MSRKCQVTGKKVMFGNNVSHANNKTRRTFFPNVQDTKIFSEALGTLVAVRISAAGMRTVEHKGGLDQYLIDTAKTKLPAILRPFKKQLEAKNTTAA